MDKKNLCLFNIQKFCIHDGPGIRTVIFFKGCPLKCKWCSNPESQEIGIGSGTEEALSGKMYSLDEVIEICLQDKDFYLESGGGVTLSGGEALVQSKQAIELLSLLKEKQIHTALETTGYVSLPIFKKAAALVDLLLYDLKHYDNEKHLQGTGAGNKIILENLRYAWSEGKEIQIRIPIIPDYNDTAEDAIGFANCIKSIGVIPVRVLPFHQFGQKKYEKLGMEYTMGMYRNLYAEDVQEFIQILQGQGIPCSVSV